MRHRTARAYFPGASLLPPSAESLVRTPHDASELPPCESTSLVSTAAQPPAEAASKLPPCESRAPARSKFPPFQAKSERLPCVAVARETHAVQDVADRR